MPAPTDPLTTLALAGLLFGVLSAIWPRPALALLLAALPLFLHQSQNPWFLRLVVLLTAFEVAYALRHAGRWRHAWAAAVEHPLLFRGALFVAAAFLSLSSLPLLGMFRQHQAVLAYGVGGDWRHYLAGLLTMPEVTREYSVIAAFLTLQAFILAVIVARETRRFDGGTLLLPAALGAGLAVFVALGLGEVLGSIRLEPLRGTTAVYPRASTVQATAGNPGWFAEFMVYALPYGLVLLGGASRRGLRLAALTVFVGLMSLGLVLGYQRGGWVAGAVVLLYLVFATAIVLRDPQRGRRTGQLVLRLVGGVAVLTALAVAFTWIWLGGRPEAGIFDRVGLTKQAFIERVTSIAKADRVVYWRAAGMVGQLHPVLGGGVESFAYRYRAYFLQPGGAYHRSPLRVPDASSAHSLYGQVFSGMGLVGLVILLSILGSALTGTVRSLRDPHRPEQLPVVVLAALGSLLGMAVYGLVQEVFYVHALRLLFFVNVGFVAAAAGRRLSTPRGHLHLAAAALVVALAVHLVYEFKEPGPGRLVDRGEPAGFYGQEQDPAGKPYRWSTEWASLPVPTGAKTYSVELRSVAPYPQVIEIRTCGEEREVTLGDQAWRRVTGSVECGAGLLELEVRPPWRPPPEERLLGVMVSAVEIR